MKIVVLFNFYNLIKDINLMVFLCYIGSGLFMYVSGQLHNVSCASAWSQFIKQWISYAIWGPRWLNSHNLTSSKLSAGYFKQKRCSGCLGDSQFSVFVLNFYIIETLRSQKGFSIWILKRSLDLTVRHATLWPGSAHDATIFRSSKKYTKLQIADFSG